MSHMLPRLSHMLPFLSHCDGTRLKMALVTFENRLNYVWTLFKLPARYWKTILTTFESFWVISEKITCRCQYGVTLVTDPSKLPQMPICAISNISKRIIVTNQFSRPFMAILKCLACFHFCEIISLSSLCPICPISKRGAPYAPVTQ